MKNTDLKLIKELYGEDFANFCLKNFEKTLKVQGLLPEIISSKFAPSLRLYDDLVNNNELPRFKAYVKAKINKQNNKPYEEVYVDDIMANNYVYANDGKLYRINVYNGKDFFCENNIVVDELGGVVELGKSRYITMDEFIIDLNENKIIALNNENDSFIKSLGEISEISVESDDDNKVITVKSSKNKEDIKIVINKFNEIIGLVNNNVTSVDADFLANNKALKFLEMKNLQKADNNFLRRNKNLEKLALPELESCGKDFLYENNFLAEFNAPKLKEAGENFMYKNNSLKNLSLNSLSNCGDNFLFFNQTLQNFDALALNRVGKSFLGCNPKLETILKKLYIKEKKKKFLHFHLGKSK